MIKTTVKCDYSKPNEAKKEAFIILDAIYTMTSTGVSYYVTHQALVDEQNNVRQEVTKTEKFISIPDFNQFSQAVDMMIQAYDISEMTPFEIEQLRLKLGLFIFVTQIDFMPDGIHVAYNILPNQWELI